MQRYGLIAKYSRFKSESQCVGKYSLFVAGSIHSHFWHV